MLGIDVKPEVLSSGHVVVRSYPAVTACSGLTSAVVTGNPRQYCSVQDGQLSGVPSVCAEQGDTASWAAYHRQQVHRSGRTLPCSGSVGTASVWISLEHLQYLLGGFAHVYLVTTAVPVHNTTRHVLKRIAVANEAMLAEVKKEVDIMVRVF
jgi:hypothetical protein